MQSCCDVLLKGSLDRIGSEKIICNKICSKSLYLSVFYPHSPSGHLPSHFRQYGWEMAPSSVV